MPAPNRIGLSPKGLLRFVLLLASACLIGALIGLVTEPLGKTASADAAKAPGNKSSKNNKSSTSDKIDSALSSLEPHTSAPFDAATKPDPSPAENDPPAPHSEPGIFTPDMRGLYIAGGVLSVFLVGAALLMKRTKGARPGNGSVHLVDTLHLGAGRLVHLVRVDGRKFLLGNSERGVHFLASIPQNEFERSIDASLDATADEQKAIEGEPTFDHLLAGNIGNARR